MKTKFYLILTLACALCFTASLAAQDMDQPEKPKAAKKAKGAKNPKAKKMPLAKSFGDAELTETQKAQLTELVKAKKEEMTTIRKSMSQLIDKENARTIKASIRKSIKGGMDRSAAQTAAWEEVGLSLENQAMLKQLHKRRMDIETGIVNQIVATFSDDQKVAMKAGLEKAKKGAKKNKGKAKKNKGEKKSADPEPAIN